MSDLKILFEIENQAADLPVDILSQLTEALRSVGFRIRSFETRGAENETLALKVEPKGKDSEE